jgi:hypothetical protein
MEGFGALAAAADQLFLCLINKYGVLFPNKMCQSVCRNDLNHFFILYILSIVAVGIREVGVLN